MASKPSIQCPLCKGELPPGRQLKDHLVDEHTKRELAKSVVAQYEELEESEYA